MVEFLLTKSADVDGTDRIGRTAVVVATIKGSQDIVGLLLNVKDINVMKKDNMGGTAIHYAAANNHVTIVERLLSCSVPVDINDNDGCTPLWWATYYCHVCCVDVLLKHGASPQHESKRGSPLEIAKKNGDSDVVEMMEEAIRLIFHPYMEGHVSVIRHQDQQTIAELQSEVEKMREELRQSSLVHESEVTRLRTEIQQKEKEVREGHMVSDESWLLSASRRRHACCQCFGL
ncbi:serine/threonine-protein phosphatase 6 regulatory ankyrin repeat subunit A-like isoform X2 [Corticium candelabrum]|uniref:serine/threonine-protein phosphatase 6 regulatory ankyrin repeat subunit A-like isoform X2 n=1 Tax=Corticium candelabrum TaxID=121492 RepID=UPI002E2653FD|nr:serine/threonine-protein phosphatase 6 regulatory ankyrin repeat subunit A-like isoform X2 [Corticium candelabrum]